MEYEDISWHKWSTMQTESVTNDNIKSTGQTADIDLESKLRFR